MADDVLSCPECRQPLKSGGLVLVTRDDDGRRACRSLWRCADRHTWWQWADRPGEPLEVCPVPQVFR
ncbi:dehydrogenase [Streptomyces sp. SID5606]|nr:dehydrogenase [Streptomyces sp. SID5606]